MLKTSLLFYKTYKLQGSSVSQLLYADHVYLFTISLFYLYSCASMIAKLITKTKAVAIIQN